MNMTKYKIQAALAAGLFLLAGCADEYRSDYQTDMPADVALANYVGSFDVLKAYAGTMHVGAEAPMSMLGTHNTAYSQLLTNFNEVTPTDAFTHAATVSETGICDSAHAVDAVSEAQAANLSLVGGPLCSPLTMQKAYMEKVTADTYIPGGQKEDDFKLVDFESMPIGTTIAASGGTKGEVVDDPLGEHGHVLHYTSSFNHPFVDITLPKGVTVGDLIEGHCDYMLKGTGWVPASVVKITIGETTIEGSTKKAVDQGIVKGEWGTYSFSFADVLEKLSDEQKAATSFRLGIGDVCSAPNYYIDNVTLRARYLSQGHYEPRPMAEKRADALKAYDQYMKTVVGNYGKDVKTWIVAADALAGEGQGGRLLTSKADGAHYFLNDFLGDDYVVDLAKMVREYQKGAKLFYSDRGLETDATKLANLQTMVKEWNDKGAGLEGVNAEVHLKYNAAQLSAAKQGIDNMLKALVATGLKVRLSGLDMVAVDDNGKTMSVKQLSEDDLKAMADYYNCVVKQYVTLVPEAQRQGISLSTYTADGKHIGLWTSAFNREATYAGVVNGLQNQDNNWNN